MKIVRIEIAILITDKIIHFFSFSNVRRNIENIAPLRQNDAVAFGWYPKPSILLGIFPRTLKQISLIKEGKFKTAF